MAALLAVGSDNCHYRVPTNLNNQKVAARPHTISAAYETRGARQRPSLAAAGLDRPVSLAVQKAAAKPPQPPGKRSTAATPIQVREFV